jgi:hypothetical protein
VNVGGARSVARFRRAALALLAPLCLLAPAPAAPTAAEVAQPPEQLTVRTAPAVYAARSSAAQRKKKKKKKVRKRRTSDTKRRFYEADPWEEYQAGGHCLYGTNGELLHSPDGKPCTPGQKTGAPAAPAKIDSDAPRRPTVSWGKDACVAGNCGTGFGTYHWADGSRYTGEFRNGKPHGEGTLIYSGGGSYVGEWRNGNRDGYGTAAYASGSTQTGLWEKGRFLGQTAPASKPRARARARRAIRWPDLSHAARRTGGGERDAAVIVGLEHYAHVPEIPRASDNAAAWFQYFVRTREVPVENVTLLLDEDGTREEILFASERAAERVGRRGTLWFVFIGHGAPAKDGSDGLLVGFDAQQKARSLEARSLMRSELLRVLERSKASHIEVLLDACFSGRVGSGDPLLAGLQPLVVTSEGATRDPRTALFTAARGNEYAGPLPGTGRPAFSYLALGGLRGWADGDEDGRVTNAELHAYVSRTMQALLHDRHQHPTLEGPGDRAIARSAREKGPDLADLVLDSARRER